MSPINKYLIPNHIKDENDPSGLRLPQKYISQKAPYNRIMYYLSATQFLILGRTINWWGLIFNPAGGISVLAGPIFRQAGQIFIPAVSIFRLTRLIFSLAGLISMPAGPIFRLAGLIFTMAGAIFISPRLIFTTAGPIFMSPGLISAPIRRIVEVCPKNHQIKSNLPL